MEVELAKETFDAAPGIDQLPNEILLTIFRNLDFKQLLQATAVCHRWNELAFFLLQDRVTFRFNVHVFEYTRQWTPNRIYRKVRSSATYVYKDFDKAWYYTMAENVKELRCSFELAHDGGLLDYLSPFKAVETLELRIDRLEVRKALNSFYSWSYGLVPSLRHLTMQCRYERMVHLLVILDHGLVSLDLEILPRLVPKFVQYTFSRLESLTLRFKARTNGCVPTEGLSQFLTKCQNLRKLALFVDEDYAAIVVAFANPSIEDLTLEGNFFRHPSSLFYGISQLTNLRSLRLSLETRCAIHLVNPLPTVESLIIEENATIPANVLTTVFPNLKVLHRARDCLTDHDVQLLVSTWQNSMEDLCIRINPKSEFITHFCGLKKLRKLTFDIDGYDYVTERTLAAFTTVAGMETLQELHLDGFLDEKVDSGAVKKRLRRASRACALYVNGCPFGKVQWFRYSAFDFENHHLVEGLVI